MKTLQIKKLFIPHQLILAPLCDITLPPFRKICKEYGAGLVFNQMVSATALIMGGKKTYDLLNFTKAEHPIGMQLFGNEAKTLAQAAKIVQDTHCDLIDLNVGCPVKKVVTDGCGSALMKDIVKLSHIIREMRRAITIPFTIKIRSGWDFQNINAVEIARMAEDEGVDAVTIHPRTRTQGYTGTADWNIITAVKNNVSLPVIGNGDIKSAHDAHRMMEQTGCDAAMIGRGAYHKPWIFKSFTTGQEYTPAPQEIKDMILRQYHYSFEFFGQEHGLTVMRKFICSYTKGMKDGATLRNKIVRLEDWKEIQKILDAFFV